MGGGPRVPSNAFPNGEAPFMARDKKKYLVEECHRLATQARRLASIPGLRPEEKADLIEVEQRWLSIARTGA
jgi:hypothetical protein